MLMINAARHLDSSFGVYGRAPGWTGVNLRQPSKGAPFSARQQFRNGVGNDYVDQVLGRSSALCGA